MAKIPPGSSHFPGRGVSLRGNFYTIVVGDQVIVKKWPIRQPTPRTKAEGDNRTLLAKAARFTAYMSAGSQEFARQLAQESKLLPRDFLLIALFNRIGYVVFKDGRKVFSMVAVQDVSNLLDAIGQVPGDLLLRGTDWWERLPAGAVGASLIIGLDGRPLWVPAGPAPSSGQLFMSAPFLNPNGGGATIGAGTFIGLPILPSADTVLTGLKIVGTAAGSGRKLTAGIYQPSAAALNGATLKQSSAIISAVAGLNTLPFAAPFTALKDTFYFIGIAVTAGSGNFQAMLSDLTRNSYTFFTNTTGVLPATAPAGTNGTGATQFNWWGY